MYRIKNDKRTSQSVEKITNSLKECLGKKHLNEINVKEISESASVSRATFYRIFDTPLDVLECLCETIAQDLEESLRHVFADQKLDHAQYTIQFLVNHSDDLKAIFRSGRMDLLVKAIRPRINWILPKSTEDLSEAEKDYIKYPLAANLISILYVWYKHGCKETVSELTRIFRKTRTGSTKMA